MVSRILSILAVAFSVACGGLALAAESKDEDTKQLPPAHKLDIRPNKKAKWDAPLQNVEKLLYSGAGELWCYFPGRRLPPILVEPKGGPIVLFRRGPDGELYVRLSTGGTLWAQYTYQFAHEFCHILCSFDGDENPNKWFEESLCETASLFVLRRMSETWKTAPPYPNWRDFTPHLLDYAQKRIADAQLPEGQTLADWYKHNAKELHGKALCEESCVIGAALLPLLEEDPKHWEAVAWLNAGRPYKNQTFEAYLTDWRYYAPDRHKPFIEKIAKQFDITLPPTSRQELPEKQAEKQQGTKEEAAALGP